MLPLTSPSFSPPSAESIYNLYARPFIVEGRNPSLQLNTKLTLPKTPPTLIQTGIAAAIPTALLRGRMGGQAGRHQTDDQAIDKIITPHTHSNCTPL